MQNSIEYLLEQTKMLSEPVLKSTILIFNLIWSVLPIVDANWGKNLIEQLGLDYSKHMRAIKHKRVQEYQFYRLYEKIHGYGVEYFNLLKTAMNCDLSISHDIIKGFKYLLNAMQPEIFDPLIKRLLDATNLEQSKFIVGKIVNNIASRSPEQAKQMLEFCFDHRLLEKDEQTGCETLFSYNYPTNEYYLYIMSSAAYHNKRCAKECLGKIIALFKLITENFEEDKHQNDFTHFSRALISPFAKFNIKYPWVIPRDSWESVEFQANLWRRLGTFNCSKIELELEVITQDDIESVAMVISDHLLPWVKDQFSKSSDKNKLKTTLEILCELHEKLCTLFPSRGKRKLREFTSFYYSEQGISQDALQKLRHIEQQIFELVEDVSRTVLADDTLKRNDEIVNCIGTIYKRFLLSHIMTIK